MVNDSWGNMKYPQSWIILTEYPLKGLLINTAPWNPLFGSHQGLWPLHEPSFKIWLMASEIAQFVKLCAATPDPKFGPYNSHCGRIEPTYTSHSLTSTYKHNDVYLWVYKQQTSKQKNKQTSMFSRDLIGDWRDDSVVKHTGCICEGPVWFPEIAWQFPTGFIFSSKRYDMSSRLRK